MNVLGNEQLTMFHVEKIGNYLSSTMLWGNPTGMNRLVLYDCTLWHSTLWWWLLQLRSLISPHVFCALPFLRLWEWKSGRWHVWLLPHLPQAAAPSTGRARVGSWNESPYIPPLCELYNLVFQCKDSILMPVHNRYWWFHRYWLWELFLWSVHTSSMVLNSSPTSSFNRFGYDKWVFYIIL